MRAVLSTSKKALAIGWCAFVALSAGAAGAEKQGSPFTEAVHRSRDSIALVKGMLDPLPTLGGAGAATSPAATAWTTLNTGFFVSADGLVLTSVYAVSGCSRVEVVTAAGQRSDADLVALDQPSGLALLKTGISRTRPLTHSPSLPEAGEWVLAGEATMRGRRETVVLLNPGLLVSCAGSVKLRGFQWDKLLVATVFCPGAAAGAPLLSADGRLVGVVLAAGRRQPTGWHWYGIPAARVRQIVSRLKRGEHRRLGWLGVALSASEHGEGVLVKNVLAGSPADEVGIKPGDLLQRIGDEALRSPSLLRDKVVHAEPGSQITIQLLRSGRATNVRVTVGTRPLLIWRKRSPLFPTGASSDLVLSRIGKGFAQNHAARFYRQIARELQRQNTVLHTQIYLLEQRIRKLEEDADR